MDLMALVIQIIIASVIVAPILWVSGRALVGKDKAKFTDAIWIVILGNVIGAAVGAFLGGALASLIMLIVWLALIKHFFDCGWLKALVVAVVAVVIYAIIVVVLVAIGIAVPRLF